MGLETLLEASVIQANLIKRQYEQKVEELLCALSPQSVYEDIKRNSVVADAALLLDHERARNTAGSRRKKRKGHSKRHRTRVAFSASASEIHAGDGIAEDPPGRRFFRSPAEPERNLWLFRHIVKQRKRLYRDVGNSHKQRRKTSQQSVTVSLCNSAAKS